MTTNQYTSYLELIKPAILQVGQALKERFFSFERASAEYKSAHEIVTDADRWSEQFIINAIQSHWPEHHILSEEAGSIAGSQDYTWVVDPLDGTTNFTIHNPLWAVSVALCYQDRPVVALVYVPMLDELFTAVAGGGAYLNDKPLTRHYNPQVKPMHAFCHSANEQSITRALKYFTQQKLQGFDCRQFGSASAELADIGAGRLDSMVIPNALPWDVAAGALIATEAGAKVTDFQGQAWNLQSVDMLAAGQECYDQVLALVHNT